MVIIHAWTLKGLDVMSKVKIGLHSGLGAFRGGMELYISVLYAMKTGQYHGHEFSSVYSPTSVRAGSSHPLEKVIDIFLLSELPYHQRQSRYQAQ